MLNWIVIWVGSYLFGLGGPLQTEAPETAGTVPSSADIPEKAKLPVFWGDPAFQGLHIGIFLALGGAHRLLDHAQSHDARIRGAGGRPQPRGGTLRRHQRRPQLLPGDGDRRPVRRPRRGARRHRLGVSCRHDADLGVHGRLRRHRRCPARPQHRRRRRPGRSPVCCARHGNRIAQPRPVVLPARSRVEPRDHHPGPDRPLRRGRRHRPARIAPAEAEARGEVGTDEPAPARLERSRLDRRRRRRLRRARRSTADRGAEPGRARGDRPLRAHDRHRLVDPRRAEGRRLCGRRRRARLHDRLPRDPLERRAPRNRGRLGRAAGGHAPLRDAARVRLDRRTVLRALGGREHRPRGDDAHRRVLRGLGLRRDGGVAARSCDRRARRRA